VLDVCYNLICLWNPRVRRSFRGLKPYAKDSLDLLVDLYSFNADKVISYRLTNWVEAQEVYANRNMIGVYVGGSAIKMAGSRNNPQNRRWRKVAKAFPMVNRRPHLRVAIKDYVNALRDGGDDAFFFAYRAIESACRDATKANGQIQKSDWDRMHQTIGTSKSGIDPLLSVAKEIRHGNVSSSTLAAARRRREKLIKIAREVLIKSIQDTAKGFFPPSRKLASKRPRTQA